MKKFSHTMHRHKIFSSLEPAATIAAPIYLFYWNALPPYAAYSFWRYGLVNHLYYLVRFDLHGCMFPQWHVCGCVYVLGESGCFCGSNLDAKIAKISEFIFKVVLVMSFKTIWNKMRHCVIRAHIEHTWMTRKKFSSECIDRITRRDNSCTQ